MSEKNSEWNPRYLQYCRVNGESNPNRMLEKDYERYTGGKMCGFILWVQNKWSQWYEFIGIGKLSVYEQVLHQDHAAFDKWLAAQDN
jgi:hypothetical protein